MELKDKNFYWIRLVTYYATKDKLSTEGDTIIGYYEAGTQLCWSIVGSDEVFKTFNKDIRMDHRETCVVPLREVKKGKALYE